MKKLIAVLVLLMLPVIATLQTDDARADDLKIAKPLTAGEILRGRFVQERSLEGFQAPLKSEGSFIVAAGRGLIWRVETPFPTTTVITPAGLVQETRGNETLRLSAARIPFMAQLYDMMSGTMGGNMDRLKQQFAVASSGSEQNWQVKLTPLSSGNSGTLPIKEIDIQGARFVDQVDIRKPNGDHDNLHFHDQTIGTEPLSDADTKLLDSASRP